MFAEDQHIGQSRRNHFWFPVLEWHGPSGCVCGQGSLGEAWGHTRMMVATVAKLGGQALSVDPPESSRITPGLGLEYQTGGALYL